MWLKDDNQSQGTAITTAGPTNTANARKETLLPVSPFGLGRVFFCLLLLFDFWKRNSDTIRHNLFICMDILLQLLLPFKPTFQRNIYFSTLLLPGLFESEFSTM